MGLFDGMGFGDGYNHSSSRRSMRRDYVTGTGRVAGDAKAEVLGTLAGLAIGAVVLFNPYNCVNRTFDSVVRVQDQIVDSSFERIDKIADYGLNGADKLFDGFIKLTDKVGI